MSKPTLFEAFVAEAAIAAYRIVKPGANADANALQAAASTDLLIGVINNLGADIGKRCDVIMAGIAEVEYGGNVTRGQKLTSDAAGKAIAAAPGAGANAQVIGIARVSGVSGDIGKVLIAPSVMQG